MNKLSTALAVAALTLCSCSDTESGPLYLPTAPPAPADPVGSGALTPKMLVDVRISGEESPRSPQEIAIYVDNQLLYAGPNDRPEDFESGNRNIHRFELAPPTDGSHRLMVVVVREPGRAHRYVLTANVGFRVDYANGVVASFQQLGQWSETVRLGQGAYWVGEFTLNASNPWAY